MSYRMTIQLTDTGERMIPEYHKGKNIYGAHIGRYQAGVDILRDKTVLDIACGSGYGTKLIATVAKKVYGVDVDRQTIDYAKQHFNGTNIEFMIGDGESIPLADKTVDVVVSYETIEHIHNYKQFLNEVKRVLKPNGLLLLSTPNDSEYIEDNHFHLHEFNYGELKKLISKYFKYRKDYFQTLWLYSSILPAELQKGEWKTNVETTNTINITPEQCIYFFMLCSDREIAEIIKPQAVIGEHYRLRDVQATNNKINDKHKALVDIKQDVVKLKKELELIKNSKSWKLAKKISKARNTFRRK